MNTKSLLIGLVLVAQGCSFAPHAAPPASVARVPDGFENVQIPGAYAPAGWWASFADPTLDGLLDEALVGNLDLQEAVARIQESRALLGISTSALFPSVTGTANASRSSSPTNTGFSRQIAELLGGLGGDSTGAEPPADGAADADDEVGRFEVATYSAALGFAYELDFWGRLRNDRSAAMADLAAAEADLHTARLGVLSETITSYFDYVDLRERVALTTEIVDVLQEREALTEGRYDRGLVTSLELYQVRQDLRNTQAGLPQLRTLFSDAERRLALLVGRFPSEVRELLGSDQPTLDAGDIPPGIPADLLLQRPDIRSAAARYEAARYRVGARKAELIPSVSLSASLGLESNEPGGLFDLSQWVSNLAAGLTAPLFQGGRLRANVSAAEARYAAAGAAYGRVVLTAYGEVELALVRHDEERTRLEFLESQLEESRSSLDLQSRRYASGVAGYTDYLDALRTRLVSEATLTSARRDFALSRLAVHRALGGGWIPASTE